MLSIKKSNFVQNSATFGGCLYGDSSTIRGHVSTFAKNTATESGGCFYVDSSTLTFRRTTLHRNTAGEGGAIYVSTRAFIRMLKTTISSNSANDKAGGLALMHDSRLLCFSCKFVNNHASRGGGLHIESHMRQIIVARLQESVFEGNKASIYGGKNAPKIPI